MAVIWCSTFFSYVICCFHECSYGNKVALQFVTEFTGVWFCNFWAVLSKLAFSFPVSVSATKLRLRQSVFLDHLQPVSITLQSFEWHNILCDSAWRIHEISSQGSHWLTVQALVIRNFKWRRNQLLPLPVYGLAWYGKNKWWKTWKLLGKWIFRTFWFWRLACFQRFWCSGRTQIEFSLAIQCGQTLLF